MRSRLYLEFLNEKPEELAARLAEWGEARYRAGQVLDWIYKKGKLSFEDMANLPKEFRARLAETFALAPLPVLEEKRSSDGSTKFLFGLQDRNAVETVWMPAARRRTICVSVQVGCKFGCRFCASGQAGFVRNLTAGEIVAQVLTASHRAASAPTHVVFMGMGEPLDNLEAVERALAILTHPKALGLSKRRITLSTVGVVPKIDRLLASGKTWELSISLHAPSDSMRSQIMPVNRAFPVDTLLAKAAEYARRTKRHVTFEYILIRGVNDAPKTARELARKLRAIPCKVNLIPYNPIAEYARERPSLPEVRRFEGVLKAAGVRATVRFSKGLDIDAACGQLRLRHAPAP